MSYYIEERSHLTFMSRPDLAGPLNIAKPDWETYCHKVADLIVGEQTPARVMEVRAKFYELLSHCIPPTIILKVNNSVATLKILRGLTDCG